LAYAVNIWLQFGALPDILILSLSFLAGGIIHLIQDSITRAGIPWFFPFSNIKTAGDYAFRFGDMIPLNLSLLVILLAGYFLDVYYATSTSLNLIKLIPIAITMLAYLIVFFIYKVHIE
jgi:membrane-bound metal-dependent hydrolase YbcI (DUF457 family)